MRILAIDPGPEEFAFVFWDSEADEGRGDFIPNCRLDFRNTFVNKGFCSNHKKSIIHPAALYQLKIDLVGIEMLQSYGNPLGRESLKTILSVGKFIEYIGYARYNIPIKLYARPTIKSQIGGKTDSQVNGALRMRLGEAKKGCKLEGVKKDIWAALALAVAISENPKLKEW